MIKPWRSRRLSLIRAWAFRPVLAVCAGLLLSGGAARADEWAYYGRDAAGTRFSPATQINRGNVARLKPAWTFHTGDIEPGSKEGPRSGFETTPLLMDGRLYLTTPFNRIIALDPASGRQLWAYDPKTNRHAWYGDGMINRGVAAWRDPHANGRGGKGAGACALSLYEATLDARLVAVDAATGQPCARFGQGGEVSLRQVKNYRAGDYHMTSPPIVISGVVVVGSAIDDNGRVDMPDGVVRGFDARTGRQLWAWEPLKRPRGVKAGAWRTGAGNAWSVMSGDAARGLVFIPTGSASPDYYGGLRLGDNRWANSVVALDARTGRLRWGFQLVHHDLWDYDTAAAPVLADVTVGGRRRAAVIAGNKTGFVYVLDRDTGKPLFPVEERAVPQSAVPGEATSPTQPYPTHIPALAPQSMTEADAWGVNDKDREACRAALARMTRRSIFSPPGLDEGLAVPGNVGGINWSGFAWDPGRGVLIASTSSFPYKVKLVPDAGVKTELAEGDLRAEFAPQKGAGYGMVRAPFMSPSHAPCMRPPWGSLVAVDVASGRILWRTPLGSFDELFPGIGKVAPGSLALGGPIVTAGGLVFSAGTMDRRIHGFDIETGREVWTGELPASAHATPMTYELGGKQYVVVAAGGSAKVTEERQDDAVVAFALP